MPSTSWNSSPVLPGRYIADTAGSRLGFRAKAFGLVWVTGTMALRNGVIEIGQGRVRASGELDVLSTETGLKLRDWHLRSGHYLHTAKHPSLPVSLVETDVTSTVASIRAVIRDMPVEFPLTLDGAQVDDAQLVLQASGEFDRRGLAMLPPVFGVSSLVQIKLSVLARRV
jgi:polyisoprenoid-binding protein YceI